MARLTELEREAKWADTERNSCSANPWKLCYGTTKLKLNPKVDDLGMTERPSTGDVQYCQIYEAAIGQYVRVEQKIPDDAFLEGAEWEAYNTKDRTPKWVKWIIVEPVQQNGMWVTVKFTPALLT